MSDPLQNKAGKLDAASSSSNGTGQANAGHALSSEDVFTGIYSGQPDDLHNLFVASAGAGDGNSAEHGEGADDVDPLAALRNDPNYAALIRDLEYIAKQARMLFEPAAEAPSDDVWKKIESQLKSENPDA